MRWFPLVVVCLLGGGCSGASSQEQPRASTPGAAVVLFEGATLIDGDTGRAVENAAFVVDGTPIHVRSDARARSRCPPAPRAWT